MHPVTMPGEAVRSVIVSTERHAGRQSERRLPNGVRHHAQHLFRGARHGGHHHHAQHYATG